MNTAVNVPSFIVSPYPHIKSPDSVSKVIWSVVVALVPAALTGIFYFGRGAAITIILSMATAVFSEYMYTKLLKKKQTLSDGSAVLTGLLLALNLSSTSPWYIPVLGSMVAIVVAKQLFGGIGLNIFNPALFGRAFLLISFPRILSTWSMPVPFFKVTDTISSATPLGILKSGGIEQLLTVYGDKIHVYKHLLLGGHSGCIGETAIVPLVMGAAYLLYKKYISWHTPIAFLGTAAVMAWIFSGHSGLFSGDPLIHVMSGGMVLGAFFMATDYATTPLRKRGKFLFGIGCGIITMVIRIKGVYPEGVMFSILIMNCFSPLLDRVVREKRYGS